MTRQVWKTQSGETINVKDMTDKHVLNTLAYLRQRHESAEISATCVGFRGDMAGYYGDHMVTFALSRMYFCEHWIKVFADECAQRGLK
jgi:hypothetical protein